MKNKNKLFVSFVPEDFDEEFIGTRFHLSVVKNGTPQRQHGTLDTFGDAGELTIFTTPLKEVRVSSREEAEREMLKAFRHIA